MWVACHDGGIQGTLERAEATEAVAADPRGVFDHAYDEPRLRLEDQRRALAVLTNHTATPNYSIVSDYFTIKAEQGQDNGYPVVVPSLG
ncbi:hypothetical protein [Haloterrigena alkaliphila]|uniref:Uncharacterized protein n=1 Tax=Haloterrigena alkaliphila TaxID=2816475 RepID=A0A8A2VCY6_9EURY|nr:hypothetical protein [Haloterrigena alkaliphila]QSW99889.1 hypothetical protein J0X25_02685 [Haloterrigena alkaliphila]